LPIVHGILHQSEIGGSRPVGVSYRLRLGAVGWGTMKRVWIAVALALLSSSATARRVIVDDVDEFIAYADTDTIERQGRSAKMLTLFDYKSKHSYLRWAYWSQRTLGEYDCKDKRAQTLHYAFYDGQMGGGELILHGAVLPGLWSPVHRGTTVEKFWKIACGK